MFFSGYLGNSGPKTSENVIEIGKHVSENRFPQLAEVDAYWTALKGSRQMPSRLEIDPRGIEGALAHTFMIERIAPGVGHIRLAGSHLNDLMGMEIRGMPLTALIAPEHRARFADYLEQVFTAPAQLIADLSAERGLGKPKCQARMLVLPLTDDENRVTRALGCLATYGGVGRPPRRFRMDTQRLTPLTGSVPLPRSVPRQNMTPDPVFAEPARPFDLTTKSGRKPVLRLIKSDK
ncbi:PAS domain-containing protein [Thalassovita sp.]|uniref:PAS domain-containing protein n=1 Tax=Thalassovita sp. TaxID=1979401 RepID=UPI003B5C2817